MQGPPTDDHHEWVAVTLGIDPRSYSGIAGDPGDLVAYEGDVPHPEVGPSPAPGWPPPKAPQDNRFATAIRIAAGKLGGAIGAQLLQLASPANIALMMTFTGAYIAAQATPVGWVADGVALVGILATAVFVGKEVFTAIDELRQFVSLCRDPSGDLDEAADHLTRAVAVVGVDTVVILLTHKAASGAKPYMKPPQGYLDVVTPDGRIVRIPAGARENPTMETRGSGQGGGPRPRPSLPPEQAKARDALASEKGKVTPKGRDEADTVLQALAEGKVKAKGTPRRVDPHAREPDHDFAIEENGKVTGYVEIKTPVDPRLRPLPDQAADIATKIQHLKPGGKLQIIIDLKRLSAIDKAAFLMALRAAKLDLNTVTILNP